MTPKEKAIDIGFKFWAKVGITPEQAKQCSIIAVDEILKSNPTTLDCDKSELNYKYWIEVKKEIEKL